MEIGIGLFGKIEYRERAQNLKKVGVMRTFLDSENAQLDDAIKCFKEYGIICETLHAPYDKINDMWYDGEAGEAMLLRLLDGVDKCEKYEIPVIIIHISSGRPMVPITKIGEERYKKLVDYASKKGVKVAFENLRYSENFYHALKNNPKAGFCWDTGHETCFTPGEKFMPRFGERLIAMHIHDNMGIVDSDDHLLPFDGEIDFEEVAKEIAKSGYNGTLMLEVSKESRRNGEYIYEDMSVEEYYKKAANALRKLADMVEKYR